MNEKAYRLDELKRIEDQVTTLITVDFSGPYDDRRPLEALLNWVEVRRVELEEESSSGGT